jgi:hypothetical protein
MEVADTVEENGENPKNNKDQQDEVEQAAGKSEMIEDDLMKLVPPVSAMIKVRVQVIHGFQSIAAGNFKQDTARLIGGPESM